MAQTLTVTEMSRKLAEYIDRVRYRRERFILTKGNKPVAEIRPLAQGLSGSDLLELIKNGPHLDPDDVEQFARDIEDARKEMDRLPVREPWED